MRLRLGASVLEKLRQTTSKEEKAWYNFLSQNAKSFTAAHTEHLAGTYNLINDMVGPNTSSASRDANAEAQISTQTSVASSADDTHSDYIGQPGLTNSGKLELGGLWRDGVNVCWRRRILGAPTIYTPRRDTTDETIQDYIFCFRAQDGLGDTPAQIQAV